MTLSLFDYDLILVSFDEPGSEEKYQTLKSIHPRVKRVHGVKGVQHAWRKAAEISETSHFVTIDADARIVQDFSWKVFGMEPGDSRIHVWRAQNSVNGLVYGHGSIHLFSKEHVLSLPILSECADFTLSAATAGFQIQEECATITEINGSPYQAWRSGFKEVAKLTGGINAFSGSKSDRTTDLGRIKIWTTLGRDVSYGDHCILGARMGCLFGAENESLVLHRRLNDYVWFESMWRNEVAGKSISDLLAKYRERLQEQCKLRVLELDADESRFLKGCLYAYDADVRARLRDQSSISWIFNYPNEKL